MNNVEQLCVIKFSVTVALSFSYNRKNIQIWKATKKKGKQLMYSGIDCLTGF